MEPSLALSSLSIPFGTLVPLSFYLIATVYIIFTAILYYHWSAYSSNTKVSALTYTLYLAITLPLMSVLFYTAFNI